MEHLASFSSFAKAMAGFRRRQGYAGMNPFFGVIEDGFNLSQCAGTKRSRLRWIDPLDNGSGGRANADLPPKLAIPGQDIASHAAVHVTAFRNGPFPIRVPPRIARAGGRILHGHDGRPHGTVGGAQRRNGVVLKDGTALGDPGGDCVSRPGPGSGIRAVPQIRVRTRLRDPTLLKKGGQMSFRTDSGQIRGNWEAQTNPCLTVSNGNQQPIETVLAIIHRLPCEARIPTQVADLCRDPIPHGRIAQPISVRTPEANWPTWPTLELPSFPPRDEFAGCS